ncbi:ATPase family AAA domain-containing protein 5b [Stigmatopora nigra]
MPNKQKRTENYLSFLTEESLQAEQKGSKRGRFWQAEDKLPSHQCKVDVVSLPFSSSSCMQSNRGHVQSPQGLHNFLQDIQASNPAFHVQNVFRMLQRKANESLQGEKNLDLKVTPESTEKDSIYLTTMAPSSSLKTHFSVETCPRVSKLSRSRRMKFPSGNGCKTPDKTLQNVEKDSHCEDVLWTDKYRPRCASELIGNILQVRKLHHWLKKWKRHSLLSESRTIKKMKNEEKSSENSSAQEIWDCGDFQGEVGSEESNEEPMCNTMLITGPLGVGKTSLVYACAQELGFQVFEVNSSSLRNGRQVLCQLREATQSHQVQTADKDPLKPAYFNNYDNRRGNHTSKHIPEGKVPPPKKVTLSSRRQTFGVRRRAGKKNAVTLTNFFKMKAKADHLCGLMPTETPNEKHKERTDCQKAPQQKNSTTSLILFEEVDVIFEDDVGFLAAIKTFMTTTKRPVVLTTNDPTFKERFSNKLEEVVLKKPSLVNICSYLQLLCLVEGAKLDLDDARNLVTLNGGDVRRCLLQLQLWVNSSQGLTVGEHTRLPQCTTGCTSSMLGIHPVSRHDLLTFLENPSWTEADLNKLVQTWRRDFPLLYSNLEILIPFRSKLPAAAINPVGRGQHFSSRTLTGSSLTRNGQNSSCCLKTMQYHKTEQSATNVRCLNGLADFSELMSYMDATITTAEALSPGACAREFVWTGVVMKDSLSDETSEEKAWSHSREKLLEIRAFVEALGCRRCWNQMSDIWTQVLTSSLEEFSDGIRFNYQPPVELITCQKRYKMSQAVLSTQPFGLLGNREAIFVDYMPTLRSISRSVRKPKDEWAKCVNPLQSLNLGLSKSTLRLLGQDFSSTTLTA